MSQMLSVGQIWNGTPSSEGMRLYLAPEGNFVGTVVALAITDPTPTEIESLTKLPLQVGITPADTLTWVTLVGQDFSFDAPYSVGIEPKRTGIRKKLSMVAGWADTIRSPLTIIVCDPRDRRIKGLRWMTLTKTWWSVFARSVLAQPETMSMEDYLRHIERDLERYPSIEHLLQAARVIEAGGV
jgi:hypothetical protein